MVNEMQIDLFHGMVGDTKVNLRANVSAGKLSISGQDFGSLSKKAFGDTEYEYFYDLDGDNTDKLFEKIGNSDFFELFGGSDACQKFRDFCDENNIEYSFCSF